MIPLIIPTNYKAKIGLDFSYPIGAEAVSAAIGEVPQARKMAITFTCYHRRVRRDKPYIVAEIAFENFRPTAFTPRNWSYAGPRWTIWIWAVPRPVRHIVHVLLKDTLSNEARSWLLTHRNVSEGPMRFRIDFDPSLKRLVCIAQEREPTMLLRHRSMQGSAEEPPT